MIALCVLAYFATGALLARLHPGYHPARVVLMWPAVVGISAVWPDEEAYREPPREEAEPVAWMYPSGETRHPVHLTLDRDIAEEECSDASAIRPLYDRP